MEFYLWGFVFCIVAAVLYGIISGNERRKMAEDAGKAIVAREDFKSDLHYVSPHDQKGLAIDTTNNLILFTNNGAQTVMPFKNLIGTEILVDGATLTRTNRGSQLLGAAVGGALLGGIGVVVGGLSGTSTSSDRVRMVILRVITDNFHNPNFDIVLLDWSHSQKGMEKSNIMYKEAIKTASAWHSRLITILKRLSEEDAAIKPPAIEHAKISIADEIEKLVQLRDKGILTEDEFAAQKASLLSA